MLDSQNDKYSAASNAQEASAFAAKSAPQEEILRVTGASWAEYHLLLGESSHHCTRIEREIRTFGGAPTIAVLLARWAAEKPETSHLAIEISLALGRDPNARLLRRELQNWQEKLPNLRVSIEDDEAAPEVAYRILMWPREPGSAASTWGAPQVLECGEIEHDYQIAGAGEDAKHTGAKGLSASGGVASAAAYEWSKLSRDAGARRDGRDAPSIVRGAERAWEQLGPHERIACELSWGQVEAAAREHAEVLLGLARETRAGESL